MKRFEAIVLSETEPIHTSLWLRPDKDKHGMTIWWYSPQGWKQLFDADTRYNIKSEFDFSPAEYALVTKGTADHKNGITEVNNTYYIYDASREIGDNDNLVNEKGLKYHIDDIQDKIEAIDERIEELVTRVDTNEENINNLQESVATLQDNIGTVQESIEDIKSSVSTIEEGMSTITDLIGNLDTRISALESTE